MRFNKSLSIATTLALGCSTNAQDLQFNSRSLRDNDPSINRLLAKAGKTAKSKCKRHTEPKKTKECKEKNPYNGLQDIVIAAPDPTPDPAAVGRCLAALMSSGYDLYDFDNYHKWFDDDSFMLVADSGFYSGAEGIKEYAKIAIMPTECDNTESTEHKIFDTVNGTQNVLPIKAEGNECTVLATSKVRFHNKCMFTGNMDTILGSRSRFTIIDDTSSPQAIIHMGRVETYFPSGALAFLVKTNKNENEARKICQTMMTACPETFEYNCYKALGEISGMDKCVSDLLSLPATDNDGPTFTGKSFGCRSLHSVLAAENKKHCGHISFDPEYDPNCYTKCQEISAVTNADMFHPIEIGFIAGEAAKHGLPVEQWEHVE